MPDGVLSVDIGPKHVEGGLPLTDDMVCMAVTAMLRDAVGLTSGEASDADDVFWDELFSNGEPVEIGAVIFQTRGGGEHSAGLDLLVMSDGTWRPDGFDSDVKGTAGDVRDYLSQWVEEQS